MRARPALSAICVAIEVVPLQGGLQRRRLGVAGDTQVDRAVASAAMALSS
jgi:hypothetical protein